MVQQKKRYSKHMANNFKETFIEAFFTLGRTRNKERNKERNNTSQISVFLPGFFVKDIPEAAIKWCSPK